MEKNLKANSDMCFRVKLTLIAITTIIASMSWTETALAIPAFARQYEVSCNVCHAAFPRLNSFGEQFLADNLRMADWKEKMAIDTGDENLSLLKDLPLAIRVQAYSQFREGEEIDSTTGPTGNDSEFDIQAPYLIKLLSSAPLSEHISFYFYAILAEKGINKETIVEDAWLRHDDIFGTGIGFQLGQFQISDLMFPRETRLPFQDYVVYRMAGITYDRSMLLDRELGSLDLALGIANGNGIKAHFDVNSPGYNRPDNLFDNDTKKSVYGRIGTDIGPFNIGLLGLQGEQRNAAGTFDTDKQVYGLDISGDWDERVYWYGQALLNRWDDFLAAGKTYEWTGGFAGVDYILNKKWVISLLYNYADANDLDNTGTVYEGININSLTTTASYYFTTNVKGIVETNFDFLKKDTDADFVGHETKEGYLIFGIDAAF